MTRWIKSLVAAALCVPLLGGILTPDGAAARDNYKTGGTRFILAVSWEPAFCATSHGKAECRNQSAADASARSFSLHGLWPMRQDYCGVSDDLQQADRRSDWASLPDVPLSPQTKASLASVMPGTQSKLERHEWLKHGTCTNMSADDYFNAAIGLVKELNASDVGALFAENIGKTLDADTIKAAFDRSFGEGAGDRVKMSCRRVGNDRVISELTIGLSRDATSAATGGPRLARLIQSAGGTSFGCNEGLVEAAGR